MKKTRNEFWTAISLEIGRQGVRAGVEKLDWLDTLKLVDIAEKFMVMPMVVDDENGDLYDVENEFGEGGTFCWEKETEDET